MAASFIIAVISEVPISCIMLYFLRNKLGNIRTNVLPLNRSYLGEIITLLSLEEKVLAQLIH